MYSEKATVDLTVNKVEIFLQQREPALNTVIITVFRLHSYHPAKLSVLKLFLLYIEQIYNRDIAKFCGLLRIYELY